MTSWPGRLQTHADPPHAGILLMPSPPILFGFAVDHPC